LSRLILITASYLPLQCLPEDANLVRARLHRIHLAVFCVLFASAALAQTPTLDHKNPVVPTATFSLEFPNADPPHYSIAVNADGRAAYQSDPMSEASTGVPYIYRFTMSPEDIHKIFNAAKQLKYFNQDFEYRKGKVAFTGNKTLAYKDGDRDFHSSYNWSTNNTVQQLTDLFEGIAETMEFGRRLTYYHSHDKLGLDAELKRMQDMEKDHQLAEIQAITPILKSIADDTAVLNISRRRAEAILSSVQPSA
jgi:hypothetical protein